MMMIFFKYLQFKYDINFLFSGSKKKITEGNSNTLLSLVIIANDNAIIEIIHFLFNKPKKAMKIKMYCNGSS